MDVKGLFSSFFIANFSNVVAFLEKRIRCKS